MANKLVQVKGFDELAKVLKQLPNELKDKEARNEMRRQMRPLQRKMKQLAGRDTGNLSGAIRFKNGKAKPDVVDVFLGVQNKSRKASHWHIVHEGTGVRKIDSYKTSPTTRAKLVTTPSGERGLAVKINGQALRFITNTGKMPAKKYATGAEALLPAATEKMMRKTERQVFRKIEKLKRKYNLK
jgi:hypothetical protein